MKLERYYPILLQALFVWLTMIVIFIIIDSVIVTWHFPQVTFWQIINYFAFPYRLDMGQYYFWSAASDIVQVVASGSLILIWLYSWFKLSKKLFWQEMKKEKLS